MRISDVVTLLAQPGLHRSIFRRVEPSRCPPELPAALARLHAQDRILLERLAAERAICHRLAVYLEDEVNESVAPRGLAGWDVDCEYNLFGSDARQNSSIDELKKRIKVLGLRGEDVADRLVYPDLIVHRRDTTINRLIVEAKVLRGDTRTDEIEYDLRKLTVFAEGVNGPRYQHALFVVFHLVEGRPAHEIFTAAKP